MSIPELVLVIIKDFSGLSNFFTVLSRDFNYTRLSKIFSVNWTKMSITL